MRQHSLGWVATHRVWPLVRRSFGELGWVGVGGGWDGEGKKITVWNENGMALGQASQWDKRGRRDTHLDLLLFGFKQITCCCGWNGRLPTPPNSARRQTGTSIYR